MLTTRLSRAGLALYLITTLAACSDDSGTSRPTPTPDQPADMVIIDPTVCFDRDGDGAYGGESCPTATDCDDSSAGVNPGAQEVCGDNIDNNCDGQVDEGCPCTTGELKSCTSLAGVDALSLLREEIHCKPGVQRCMAGAWGECEGEVGPLDEEQCNGVDDNCDGRIDEGQRNLFGQCLSELPDGWMPPAEDCGPAGEGNGLDDNGNGEVDEGCSCAVYDPSLERKGQVCYSGPPGTLGVGVCQGGLRDCTGGVWGNCAGQVLPSAEICGDALDNDCDGIIDNGCPVCVPSNSGVELCDGQDNDCDGIIDNGVRNACGGCGEVSPNEICGDGIDNNCNGLVDERCSCELSQQPCYAGAPEHAGVGACVRGVQQCTGEFYGLCLGSVLPVPEVCGDGVDNDCDGVVDNGCGCVESSTRPCGTSTGACERGQQTCSAGVWGACEGGVAPTQEVCDGQDNDCDGLADEGLLNACGLCGAPCYTRVVNPADGTTDSGAQLIPANDPENPRNEPGVTLSKSAFVPPYLWAANQDFDTVTKFNTDTSLQEGQYWVGDDPSRTAVDLDGNMWVGGRQDGRLTKIIWDVSQCPDRNGNGTIETSRAVNGVPTQLNSAADPLADECVVFSEVINPSLRSIRGIAAAPDGTVWVGYTSGGVQAIERSNDPNVVTVGPYYAGTQVPVFRPGMSGQLEPVMVNGQQQVGNGGLVYGLVVTSSGALYVSSFTRDQIARFNTVTREWEAILSGYDCGSYGIATDSKGRVWTGGWPGCPGIGMYDPAGNRFHYFKVPRNTPLQHGAQVAVDATPEPSMYCNSNSDYCVTGLGVEPATGDVWVSFYSLGYNGRLALDENNLAASQWTLIGTTRNTATNAFLPGVSADLRGVGFDRNGFAWTMGLGSDRVWKIDPATNSREAGMPLGTSIGQGTHYTYSDFTGSTSLNFTAPRGTWRYVFNTRFDGARADGIIVDAHAPANTTVQVRVRPLDASGAPIGPWTPDQGYLDYPTGQQQHTFDLSALPPNPIGHQFEFEVRLGTSDPNIRPILYGIDLDWQRP